MERRTLRTITRLIQKEATAEDCVELERLVAELLSARVGQSVLARRAQQVKDGRTCPHCGCSDVVRNGLDDQKRQRFRCRANGCGKGFNALTGTPLARLRKPELWLTYARLMMRSQSLKRITEEMPISGSTAFRWRHRFLELPTALQAEKVQGIVEIDETFFLRSFKGHRGWKNGQPPAPRPPRYRGSGAVSAGLSAEHVPVLTAVDQAGGVVEEKLAKRTSQEIERALNGRIAQGALVRTDGLKAYKKVLSAAQAHHQVIRPKKQSWVGKIAGAKPRQRGTPNLGRVSQRHERIKDTLDKHFRGVSTHNINRYLGYLRLLSRRDLDPAQLIEFAARSTKK
jgi:transposase-like protein